MRTNKTKEEFIKDVQHRIKLREEVLSFYKTVYLPTLKRFDGKVYNARFRNELNKQAQAISERIFVSEEYGGNISISILVYEGNYGCRMQLLTTMVTNDEGRIDYEAYMNNFHAKLWLDSFNETTKEYKRAIANYDDYMKLAQEMEDAVNKYNNLPHIFRDNHDKSFLRIY